MFRRSVLTLREVLNKTLREGGLETPLLQKRLMDAWNTVAGAAVARYTQEKFIRNQTLYVKISSPALRADLSMMKTELVRKLNASVRSQVIVDIRFC